jgi:hypothetical protein
MAADPDRKPAARLKLAVDLELIVRGSRLGLADES